MLMPWLTFAPSETGTARGAFGAELMGAELTGAELCCRAGAGSSDDNRSDRVTMATPTATTTATDQPRSHRGGPARSRCPCSMTSDIAASIAPRTVQRPGVRAKVKSAEDDEHRRPECGK